MLAMRHERPATIGTYARRVRHGRDGLSQDLRTTRPQTPIQFDFQLRQGRGGMRA
ncbi:MAG: hypothetical protein V9F06_15490 [Thermomicrobiales bacterium]